MLFINRFHPCRSCRARNIFISALGCCLACHVFGTLLAPELYKFRCKIQSLICSLFCVIQVLLEKQVERFRVQEVRPRMHFGLQGAEVVKYKGRILPNLGTSGYAKLPEDCAFRIKRPWVLACAECIGKLGNFCCDTCSAKLYIKP